MNYKKLAALGASLAVAGGMVVSASGATGAYFSQTQSGTITGTLGTVAVTTSGGNNNDGSHGYLDFQWTNMLPGVPNTATVNYTNTGTANADIYLQFPNDTALSALNDLGTYGAASITTSGWGTANGTIFQSTDLRDTDSSDTHGCHASGAAYGGGVSGGQNYDPTGVPAGGSGCNPVRNEVLIASNVPAGQGGSFTFSFNYASKLTGDGPGVFNTYPASLTGSTSYVHHTDDNSSALNGLPFQVVALQTGAPALVPTN